MNAGIFRGVLRAGGLFIIGAGAMHVVFGLGADVMLGVLVSEQTLSSPGLDSQNRFYGGTFVLYGVLLLLIATDLPRYAPVLRALLWVFWLAGLARFLSVWFFGWPPLLVGVLFAAEVLLPPVLLIWLSRLQRQ